MKRASRKTPYRILTLDPLLKPYAADVALRMERNAAVRKQLLGDSAALSAFANGYLYYGFHRTQAGWVFREWAPGADAIHLIGDFNDWNRASHPLRQLDGGVWEIELSGADALKHGQHVKLQITRGGRSFDRIPAYIRYTVQDPLTHQLTGVIWAPERPFQWTDGGYGRKKISPLMIYEAHIGMAQEREGIGTYREFADFNLERIKSLGYNAVQLMAVMEHPYYASFGYQVSSFFAASHWYGEPDDLKALVDKAHSLGMYVLLDVVHSHACANVGEGLNLFDGTEDQYFLPGERGNHPAWGSKLFNYAKHEVIHFLLSNLKFWQEEYHFDGFRFDGVTSMIYQNHGLGENFTDYSQYFGLNTNVDALTYLQLANELIHEVNPFAVTIAEDMSGMPGMALPIRSGGIGFDYRLSMGIPDFWIRLLKDVPDRQWDMGRLWYERTPRRPQEQNVGDGAAVGGRQDADLPHGRRGDVHGYGQGLSFTGHRPRHRAAQDDSLYHPRAGQRGLSELHGQRIRPSRVDRLSPRGQRLEPSLRPPPVVAGGKRLSEIRMAGALRPGDAQVRAQISRHDQARRGEPLDG